MEARGNAANLEQSASRRRLCFLTLPELCHVSASSTSAWRAAGALAVLQEAEVIYGTELHFFRMESWEDRWFVADGPASRGGGGFRRP